MDVTELSFEHHEFLTTWTGLYKELRGLLHSGDVVRADHPDPSVWVHGVVAARRIGPAVSSPRRCPRPTGRARSW